MYGSILTEDLLFSQGARGIREGSNLHTTKFDQNIAASPLAILGFMIGIMEKKVEATIRGLFRGKENGNYYLCY